MSVNITIKQLRKTAAQWVSDNTVLGAGVIGFETDTAKYKLGDGVTAWNSLSYPSFGVSGVAWGSITGTLSNQTDLQSALDLKANLAGASFTGAVSVTTSGSGDTLQLTNSGSGTTLNILNSGSGDFLTIDGTKFVIDNGGDVSIGTAAASARFHVLTGSTSKIGAIIQAAAGQTANLQEWRDSAGTARGYMTWTNQMILSLMDNGSGLGTYSQNEIALWNNRLTIQSQLNMSRIFYTGTHFNFEQNNASSTRILGLRMLDPVALGASSGEQIGLEIYPAINQSGTAGYSMIKVNPSVTGAGSGSKFLTWLGVGGTPRFSVESDGTIRTNGNAGFTGTGSYTNFTIENGIITAAS